MQNLVSSILFTSSFIKLSPYFYGTAGKITTPLFSKFLQENQKLAVLHPEPQIFICPSILTPEHDFRGFTNFIHSMSLIFVIRWRECCNFVILLLSYSDINCTGILVTCQNRPFFSKQTRLLFLKFTIKEWILVLYDAIFDALLTLLAYGFLDFEELSPNIRTLEPYNVTNIK